ncbi:MAG TPA: histidine phosphatase family protein, partial [Dongiaceae bacterium]|nr:histidine phosphatase family protein [Dongiaceae bacterium]
TDIALTANGELEAQEVAQRLGDVPFSQALTSPRLRARQACRLAKLGKLAEIEPDLAEWDYGDYEGKRPMDIRRQQSDWNLYQHGCPQGETPEQITARADRQISRLRTLRGNIALFSHGQFGSALAVRWVGLPLMAAAHFPLAMASISILTFSPHYPEVPVIALWNAVSRRQTTPPATLADAALQL